MTPDRRGALVAQGRADAAKVARGIFFGNRLPALTAVFPVGECWYGDAAWTRAVALRVSLLATIIDRDGAGTGAEPGIAGLLTTRWISTKHRYLRMGTPGRRL